MAFQIKYKDLEPWVGPELAHELAKKLPYRTIAKLIEAIKRRVIEAKLTRGD